MRCQSPVTVLQALESHAMCASACDGMTPQKQCILGAHTLEHYMMGCRRLLSCGGVLKGRKEPHLGHGWQDVI